MATLRYRLGGVFAAGMVLAASWALAEGTAAVSGASAPSWQTLAVSLLAVLSGWLQYQAKRAQSAAARSLDGIERTVDRLAEQLRGQGERLARLEGEHAARHIWHREGR